MVASNVENTGKQPAESEHPADCTCGYSHGYLRDKAGYLARLKRIEGQVRGVQRMVDEEQYCIDILTQVSALQSALKGVGLALLNDHMASCVVTAARQGDEEAAEKLEEVAQAFARFSR